MAGRRQADVGGRVGGAGRAVAEGRWQKGGAGRELAGGGQKLSGALCLWHREEFPSATSARCVQARHRKTNRGLSYAELGFFEAPLS
jgi:hypothetical protein